MSKNPQLIWQRSPTIVAHTSCLLLHGLNNHVETMRPLATALNEYGIECALARIPGHGPQIAADAQIQWAPVWQASFHEQVNQFKSQTNSTHHIFLGNSLGALIAQCYQPLKDNFSRQILIAPALYLSWQTKMLLYACQYFDFKIPSLAPGLIRAHSRLPANYYRALFELNQRSWSIQLPTLLLMARQDELVSYHKTLSKFPIETVAALKRPFHWITHPQNLSAQTWQWMVEKMFNFIQSRN